VKIFKGRSKVKTEQSIVVIAVVALAALAWALRWDVTPLHDSEGFGGVYIQNRWTGAGYMVRGATSHEVKPYKPAPKANIFDDLNAK
jgi:hypothetical protein